MQECWQPQHLLQILISQLCFLSHWETQECLLPECTILSWSLFPWDVRNDVQQHPLWVTGQEARSLPSSLHIQPPPCLSVTQSTLSKGHRQHALRSTWGLDPEVSEPGRTSGNLSQRGNNHPGLSGTKYRTFSAKTGNPRQSGIIGHSMLNCFQRRNWGSGGWLDQANKMSQWQLWN